jgi:phage major head subunit gpT-like protein
MIINQANMAAIFTAFRALFNTGFEGAPTAYKDIAMVVPSSAREEVYAWLGQFSPMREWIGPRVVRNLAVHDFSIKNRDFENTVSVPRNDIEDDRYGVFGPMLSEMGKSAAEFPDQLVFALLAAGFSTNCYDGQTFFDTDHPVRLNGEAPPTSVSNMQDGAQTPWFLLDTSRSFKPLICQDRRPFKLVSKDRLEDDNVFSNKEFIYGVDGRMNVGFGLWQLAFASKAALNADNYAAARAAMMNMKGDGGRPLGIKPTTLVVPPTLEKSALQLINNGTRVEVVGETPVAIQNEWANTAKLIVTPWLS